MKPKISICIPTFNRADLFEKTLQSVVFQIKKAYEIIVIDNHSTDNTPQVVKRYKKYKIKYYRHKRNIGFVENWNKCIEYATGDYICILHSDDLISKNWYKDWEKIIEKNSDCDAFFSSWAFIDGKDNVTSVYVPFSKSHKFRKGNVIKEFYSKNFLSPLVSGGLILKKDLFNKNKIGRFQKHLETETDIAMFFPLMLHYSLYYYNKVLMGYRVHEYQTIVKKIERVNTERLIASAKRYFEYIHKFYYTDLVPALGEYDIFYKKLLITYQFKAIYRSFKQKDNLFDPINRLIQKSFPNFLKPWEYYLYFVMMYEFAKRYMYGISLVGRYKNVFK